MKYALYGFLLSVLFWLGVATVFAEEQSCRKWLEVCERSCSERQGVKIFVCSGDQVDTLNPYRCRCLDE
jgi:hypothetical protein